MQHLLLIVSSKSLYSVLLKENLVSLSVTGNYPGDRGKKKNILKGS